METILILSASFHQEEEVEVEDEEEELVFDETTVVQSDTNAVSLFISFI